MIENKNQFYLHDRWYYLLDETENKLIYSSKPNDKTDGNRIEIDKENNKINIIFMSNKKTLGKLEINCINDNNIKFHYSQYECVVICVNNEKYENLLYELFATRENRKVTDKIKIKFAKKRKLNRMCYREPKFAINQRILLRDVEFSTREINFFREITDTATVLIPKILKLTEQKNIETKEEIIDKIMELKLPETLQVYDRTYSLVRYENEKIMYISNESGVTNLEIKINPSTMDVANIKFVTKSSNENEPPKHIIQMKKTEKGISARYHNCKKTDVYINGQKHEEARIKSEVLFDTNDKNIETFLEIETKYDKYKLIAQPNNCNQYQDNKINTYEVYSNYHVDFQSMTPYIPGIFRNIENNILKEKELIKK